MVRIIVQKNSYEHLAWFEECPGDRRGGVSVESAVRNLISSRPDLLSDSDTVEISFRLSEAFLQELRGKSVRVNGWE